MYLVYRSDRYEPDRRSVNLDSFAYFGTFVSNGYDIEDECGFYLYDYGWIAASGQDFGLGIRTETGMYYVETASIYKTHTWYHLAATYDDANNVSIYVDANLAAGPTDVGGPIRWVSSDSNSYPPNFKMGVMYYPTSPWGYYFADSKIDDVRFYNYALSQGEIAVLAEKYSEGEDVYQPVPSVANLTDPEAQFSRKVNFHDYRILADHWLEEPPLWPSQ